MNNVKFELYKVFYCVAKSLSFSEAANELFISQSAVSQSIKSLEEKLNCRLFLRNKKQVRLTQEGELLYKHAEQAMNAIRAGERSIQDIHSLEQGEVRIGASDTICKYYLLPFFKEFNEKYPKIKIHVTNRTSPACIELLQKGNIDLAVVNLPEKELDKKLEAQKLQPLQDVFIAGRNFSKLKNKQIELAELAQYPLLMLERHTVTREFFDSLMEQQGLDITPEVDLGSVDLLIELARIGLGISFVPREYVRREMASGEVFELKIKNLIPRRYLGMVTMSGIPLPAAAQKFTEMLG